MIDITHMLDRPPGEPLIEVQPAPGRRAVGVFATFLLGLLMLWLGLSTPGALALRGILVILGGAILWFSWVLWTVSGRGLVLTSERLCDSTGRVLAEVADITGVERGALAIKPSNGFLAKTRTPQPTAWVPGVWWRIGRWVGVGGLTNAGQLKAMAELLQVLVSSRQGD